MSIKISLSLLTHEETDQNEIRAHGTQNRALKRRNLSSALDGKVDISLHGKANSNSHGARPVYYNHLDDEVDSDRLVVDKEVSLSSALNHG